MKGKGGGNGTDPIPDCNGGTRGGMKGKGGGDPIPDRNGGTRGGMKGKAGTGVDPIPDCMGGTGGGMKGKPRGTGGGPIPTPTPDPVHGPRPNGGSVATGAGWKGTWPTNGAESQGGGMPMWARGGIGVVPIKSRGWLPIDAGSDERRALYSGEPAFAASLGPVDRIGSIFGSCIVVSLGIWCATADGTCTEDDEGCLGKSTGPGAPN